MVFHRLLDAVPASRWQVVQEIDRLSKLLSSVRDGFMDETLTNALQQPFMALGAVVPPIGVRRMATIPQTTAGKASLITSTAPRVCTPSGTLASDRER
jgi:hypothetical protein